MEIILTSLAVASLSLNAFLYYRLRQKSKRTETYDVKALLSDLMRGRALVEIRRIDPEAIYIRSPRELN